MSKVLGAVLLVAVGLGLSACHYDDVYVAPAPVVVAPRPVVVAPRPVVVAPRPARVVVVR